ncbi:hypothetical protein J2S74_001980 [Evansella vedderi]|uniref:Uncharacterized protein n=1 Tax=Evansella vedderi TaxID=38282 RepID=A0ABT9ZTM8_9BACI|nr:hypothetical protein [Evansella vedderi]
MAFDDSEVLNMIEEVNVGGYKIIEISESWTHLLSIGENQQLKDENNLAEVSSIDDFELLIFNSSFSTVQNRQLLNKYKKINSNKQNINKETLLINKELTAEEFRHLMINACNEYYNEFAINRWNKKSWNALVEAFVNETIVEGRYVNVPADKINGYAYISLKNMAHKFDLKNGRKPLPSWMTK